MTFSVIIPTYNRADLLDRCLDSLVRQTFGDFEVLVCDDGSTDDSRDVAERYKDRLELRYLWDENWGGPARPRNRGIAEARGEWICFLDSDDWWTPDKLEACLPYLADHDIIYHDMYVVKQGAETRSDRLLRGWVPQSPAYQTLLIRGNCAVNSSVVLRRSVADRVGPLTEDRALIAVEDFDYWLSVSRVTERFCHIAQPLGYYWMGETSISYNDKWFARHQALYAKHLPNIRSGKATVRIQAAQAYRAARTCDSLYRRADRSVKYYRIALRSDNPYTKTKALGFLVLAWIKTLFSKKTSE